MTAILDTRRIRASTPAQLRDYYKELSNQNSHDTITAQLLHAVEQGSVPPLTFAPWLGVSKSPSTIHDALKQNKSVLVRKLAIKQFKLALGSSKWREMWDGVGGTVGVLDIFSDLSVREVREACKSIGRSAKGRDLAEKRECFTELFKALHPHAFPDATFRTTDQRPLAKHYRLLIPACSEELVDQAVADGVTGVWKNARERDLLWFHSQIMRREQLRVLSGERPGSISQHKLEILTKRYPSATSTERGGFSASMEFALVILRRLAESETDMVEDDFFIHDLVRPLLSRAVRKRAKWETIQEIVDLTMQYLEAHPIAGKEITTTVGDVLHQVVLCWSRKPHLFETQLRRLFSHPVFGTGSGDELLCWSEDFLAGIPQSRRWSLLQLCFQELTGLNLDVDEDLKKVKGELSPYLLTSLGNEQALSFFNRMRKARGDENLVERDGGNSTLRPATNFEVDGWDAELYHIFLLSWNEYNEKAEELATGYLRIHKKKAVSASQPEERSSYAKSALSASVASGSLSMLQETLDWTRRFIRDSLVLRDLYWSMSNPQTIRLLSGIPEPIKKSSAISDLRARVEKGNSILVSIFDTACLALREPSFSTSNWKRAFSLFFEVISARIDLSLKLKNLLDISDDELYDVLWESTIPMLIEVEEKAHQEGHERLEANGLRGFLVCYIDSRGELKTEDKSTYTFLDNLAKARDGLWCKLRSAVYPAVDALAEPFPRGLPIQHLIAPWNLNVQDLEGCAPYLASRVKTALFLDPSSALQAAPIDEDSEKAVGVFVDSYQEALKLYIPTSCEKAEKENRLRKAWNHAKGPLSQDRMSEEEAVRFWRDKKPNHLKEWPPKELAGTAHPIWPLIPETEDPAKPEAWNPFTSGRPDEPARDLGQRTYIDLSVVVLEETPTDPMIHHIIDSPELEVPANEVDKSEIWSSSRHMGEGGVLSALLYLDTKFRSNDERLLRTPFPSADAARYPALYLDDEFLSDEALNPLIAVRNIQGHLNAMPPALLAQLARNVLSVLDSADPDASTYVTLHEVAMLLVVRLAETDRPGLAVQLAVRTVLDRPKSSSWHRQLLKSSFFRRLPASDAQACFELFAAEIMERLPASKDVTEPSSSNAENVEEKPQQVGDNEQESDRPYVKVTTIKFLAQLLRETEVAEDYALSLLSTLSQKSSHIDVRSTIFNTLLSMLKLVSAARFDDVLAAMEFVIPLAGSLNERDPLTESDWKTAEENLSLPEVQEDSTIYPGSSSRILEAMLTHYREEADYGERCLSFVERILLPTLACLQQQMTKWVALFLRKYGVGDQDLEELHIPPIPPKINLGHIFLPGEGGKASYLPRTLLEEYVAHMTVCITPPAPIRALNKKLEDDTSLKTQPEVQTWLDLYGRGINALSAFRAFKLPSLLDKETVLSEDTGITPKVIQEQFLKLFTAILWNDTPSYKNMKGCLTRPLLDGEYLAKPWWQEHGKPIVEAILTYVSTIRTRDWERDVTRKPAVLPETFPWRLLLLDYPWPKRDYMDADGDAKCRTFAKQLASIINGITGPFYHIKLAQLKSYLALDPVTDTKDRSVEKKCGKWTMYYDKPDRLHEALMYNRALTAVYLGDISETRLSWLTAPELLRVDVAGYLVGIAGEPEDAEKGVKKKLKELLESWCTCENEEVRRLGFGLLEKWKDGTS